MIPSTHLSGDLKVANQGNRSIEEVDMDTKNPDYFDGYFNNGKLSLLRNTELGTVRILVQSFSSDRILSQDGM